MQIPETYDELKSAIEKTRTDSAKLQKAIAHKADELKALRQEETQRSGDAQLLLAVAEEVETLVAPFAGKEGDLRERSARLASAAKELHALLDEKVTKSIKERVETKLEALSDQAQQREKSLKRATTESVKAQEKLADAEEELRKAQRAYDETASRPHELVETMRRLEDEKRRIEALVRAEDWGAAYALTRSMDATLERIEVPKASALRTDLLKARGLKDAAFTKRNEAAQRAERAANALAQQRRAHETAGRTQQRELLVVARAKAKSGSSKSKGKDKKEES